MGISAVRKQVKKTNKKKKQPQRNITTEAIKPLYVNANAELLVSFRAPESH